MDPFLISKICLFLSNVNFVLHSLTRVCLKQTIWPCPGTNNIAQTTLPHPILRKIVLNCIVCPLYIHKVAIDVHTSNSNFKIHRGSWDI